MKKKGFTLIELLAVIVILAIIALIATPLVLKYIDKSNREALKNSIYSIDRAILMQGTIDRKDKEYTSIDELDVKVKDTDIKISYVDVETRYYKVKNENYLLDVKKCATKKYCTIDEIESIKNVIIHKSELFPNVEDNNPGIICGEGTTEDTTLTTCHIRSIEDLVQLSNLVNKGTTFQDKKVELVNSLDFNNKKSYASRKVNDSLISGEGFTPIGNSSYKTFQGTFEGNDNIIKGLYINRTGNIYFGLFGYTSTANIQNLDLLDSNLNINVNKGSGGALIGQAAETNVENIKMVNTLINAYSYSGGLIGRTVRSNINNIEADNIMVTGLSDYIGGLIGHNSYSIIKNIELNKIDVSGGFCTGGLIGTTGYGDISKIKINNIVINNHNRYTGGLVGLASEASISMSKVSNATLSGQDRIGGIVGQNNKGLITNIKFQGSISGTGDNEGIALAWNNKGVIKNVVVKGSLESTANVRFGGIAGFSEGTSETENAIVIGVVLPSIINGKSQINRGIGFSSYTSSNILASSSITVNGSTVESNDSTSLNGKSLDDMGKVSQSEYEALGFEFESTDTNEAYWYFNENDELDLIIK